MHFSRLRLNGFKSFVDGAELAIEPGLTGIVGPNGCGKSNLVEGLRWAMGESSARQLRGREMDDVIFGGSAERPARNHAEVSILLDNSARTAPAIFADVVEIEVRRRIVRGEGSVYRINGKETRARDVQLLFADEATGARSTALVSQGRIGAIVAAKPVERRGLLEEAAGITGLHNRRHEAELRLRAAEGNLLRLDDVMGALETQLQGLKRQARQAARYRRLSDRIRRAEALLFHCRLTLASAAEGAAKTALDTAERTVAETTARAAAVAAARADAAAALPPLREAAAAAGARLHRLEVAQVELDAEQRRLAERRQALDARLAQIVADIERETALADDAETAIERLQAERADLVVAANGEDEAVRAAEVERARLAEAVSSLEGEVEARSARRAAAEARRAALDREIQDVERRLARLAERAVEIESERAAVAARAGEGADGDALEQAVRAARGAAEEAERRLDAAEKARLDRSADEAAAREARQTAETALAALAAEAAALSEILGADAAPGGGAMIDAVTVDPGYEIALGAALGDDLAAAPDPGAPRHWRTLPPRDDDPALPAGVRPLAEVVAGPPALARRLSQTGIVAAADGHRLQAALRPGQRLVDRDGGLWRWDGLTVAAEAETAAATRLRQRNRLGELGGSIAEHDRERAEAERVHAATRAALERAASDEAAARDALRAARESLDTARDAHARAVAATAADRSRLATLDETAMRLVADRAELDGQRATALAARAALAPESDGEGEGGFAALRGDLGVRRAELATVLGRLDEFRREAAARRRRLAAIDDELPSWRHRAEGARDRLDQLDDRRQAAGDEQAALADRPAEIAARRARLFDELDAARDGRDRAADAVAKAETRLAERDRVAREADAAVAGGREERVRAEATRDQARAAVRGIEQAIEERLGSEPAALAALAGLDDDDAAPDVDTVEATLARLLRERDGMGPVNLRAEAEADEVASQIAALADERADLEAAIARLRGAITRLNREAADRLTTAFEAINGHFGALFTRLFGGGRAHLSLVDADDPLEAGLEIMASPPGKRLQSLSLLSGGEQALTALALQFAVFLTNPAPICVLDEVDAPLDDANVGRFCDLVGEIAHATATRFLVVTHHAMTMARMDRLFGVTMAERGVSQLVSVDLGTADTLRATG